MMQRKVTANRPGARRPTVPKAPQSLILGGGKDAAHEKMQKAMMDKKLGKIGEEVVEPKVEQTAEVLLQSLQLLKLKLERRKREQKQTLSKEQQKALIKYR